MIKLLKTNATKSRLLLLLFIYLLLPSCNGQVSKRSAIKGEEKEEYTQPLFFNQNITFPQIYSPSNGMVKGFVRTIYQDNKRNYGFETNGDDIISYNGKSFSKITIESNNQPVSVRKIVEDTVGNIWFGTSTGLVKYNGQKFAINSKANGLQDDDISGLTMDTKGFVWGGTINGVSHFNVKKFPPFTLPDTMVKNLRQLLSDKLDTVFLEDRNGVLWLVANGHENKQNHV